MFLPWLTSLFLFLADVVANNIVMLYTALSSLMMGKDMLSPGEMEILAKTSGAILHLTPALALAACRVMAWSMLTQQHLWLSHHIVSEAHKTRKPVSLSTTQGQLLLLFPHHYQWF